MAVNRIARDGNDFGSDLAKLVDAIAEIKIQILSLKI
jgi:hypothetical protein